MEGIGNGNPSISERGGNLRLLLSLYREYSLKDRLLQIDQQLGTLPPSAASRDSAHSTGNPQPSAASSPLLQYLSLSPREPWLSFYASREGLRHAIIALLWWVLTALAVKSKGINPTMLSSPLFWICPVVIPGLYLWRRDVFQRNLVLLGGLNRVVFALLVGSRLSSEEAMLKYFPLGYVGAEAIGDVLGSSVVWSDGASLPLRPHCLILLLEWYVLLETPWAQGLLRPGSALRPVVLRFFVGRMVSTAVSVAYAYKSEKAAREAAAKKGA